MKKWDVGDHHDKPKKPYMYAIRQKFSEGGMSPFVHSIVSDNYFLNQFTPKYVNHLHL